MSPHGQGGDRSPFLKGGGDGGYGEHVPRDGGEQFENLNTPVSKELVVKRNEPTKRHFTLAEQPKKRPELQQRSKRP